MNQTSSLAPFPAAQFIREIGRGKKGARSLSRADAHALYTALLDGRVSDMEVGALLLAMRIKGESLDELGGFLQAAHESFALLTAPVAHCAPVVLPSYNGARQLPNLLPLLAMLLARQGVPVLIHGVLGDPNRVTTADILHEMGVAPCASGDEALQNMRAGQPAFLPIGVLAPKLERMLCLRHVLGVRNSTHTLVKLLQPFATPALRLFSYTHPEYRQLLTDYFSMGGGTDGGDAGQAGDVFLMRGTEGETVANPRRANQIDWFHAGQATILVERAQPSDDVPALPGKDAAGTAAWIARVLKGEEAVPPAMAEQADHCCRVARGLAQPRSI